jgi:UMF1 family MFS transporter
MQLRNAPAQAHELVGYAWHTCLIPMDDQKEPQQSKFPPAKRGEILAWASYDVANSTYATVVATAVYNAHFVNVIAANLPGRGPAFPSMMLELMIAVSSAVIVISAPVIGTICDATASKKKMLFWSTAVCIVTTAALSFIRPGHYLVGMIVMGIANIAFWTGEDLIASFLPELAHKDDMGRISAIGWAAGYVGSLFSLAACAAYMVWAQKHGETTAQYVPKTMVVCALYFAVAVIPTFIWLKERAVPDSTIRGKSYFVVGLSRLKQTILHARHYRDLFNFLITLFVYSCGTQTVVHFATVYAQQALHFTARDSVTMILVVNITGAIGASVFGTVQDKIGSIRTLALALFCWLVAILVAVSVEDQFHFWIAANLVGISMGASGSVGRALVGQFSPPGRSGEFLGLWGVAVKAATCVGAISFGCVLWITHNDLRSAMLSIELFFVLGILLLFRVDEKRGKLAANEPV